MRDVLVGPHDDDAARSRSTPRSVEDVVRPADRGRRPSRSRSGRSGPCAAAAPAAARRPRARGGPAGRPPRTSMTASGSAPAGVKRAIGGLAGTSHRIRSARRGRRRRRRTGASAVGARRRGRAATGLASASRTTGAEWKRIPTGKPARELLVRRLGGDHRRRVARRDARGVAALLRRSSAGTPPGRRRAPGAVLLKHAARTRGRSR